ncbi:hypothetical protein MKW98_021914 [Papaver atlanticum]|uniref:Uncharacterized protein n=1 Tax=Papaver atlanticum TaxID=357466 RepID=A0AAD4TM22_9MAGN|nr:hypothetical protein MKW98_021914 [Papaver atlanticum]
MKVVGYLHDVNNILATLGMDSSEIIKLVHPSLDGACKPNQQKYISDATLARLNSTVDPLKEEKQIRLEKLYKTWQSTNKLVESHRHVLRRMQEIQVDSYCGQLTIC